MTTENKTSDKQATMPCDALLATVADLLTDYLAGIDYKPEQDIYMDKIIKLLNIEFGHDDMDELYWYYNGC